MTRKRVLVLMIVGLVGATMVSAQATGMGPGTGLMNVEVEETTLTGTLGLEEDQLPVLTADGEEYTLMIPPGLAAELDVRNGQRITVEGFVVERPSPDLLGSDRHMMVRVVQIGNDRFIASRIGRFGGPGMGPGAGPMGGRMHGGIGPGMNGPMWFGDEEGFSEYAPGAGQGFMFRRR